MRRVYSVAVFVLVSVGLGAGSLYAQNLFTRGQNPYPRSKAASQALAQTRTEQKAEKERLVEALIVQRESEAGPIASKFRAVVKHQLLKKPLEVLRKADARVFDAAFTSQNLMFTPVAPCRILDTRASSGGILAVGAKQAFLAVGETTDFTSQGGNALGCGIPAGATSIAVNFGATQSAGPGNIRAYAWASSATAPLAATVNFGNLAWVGLNTMPNGAVVPLCDPFVGACTADLYLEAFNSNTHAIADVTGYFMRATVWDELAYNDESVYPPTATGECTNYIDYNGDPWGIVFYAPVAGRITITGTVQYYIAHTAGQPGLAYTAELSDDPTVCYAYWGLDAFGYLTPNTPSGDYYPVLPIQNVVEVLSPGLYMVYLNGRAVPDAATTDTAALWYAGLTTSFQPY